MYNHASGATSNVAPVANSFQDCDDSHGTPWTDSVFSTGRSKFPRVHLNGTRVQTGIMYTITNVPLNVGLGGKYITEPWEIHGTVAGSKYPTSTLANKALANANPNTPVVDLPVSILELRELPGLLRDAGRIALKRLDATRAGAKANLMGQFGIIPVINDVRTLLDFADKVAEREAYLIRLNSEKPIRIKRKITEQTWDVTVTPVAWASNAENSATFNKIRLNYKTTSTYWYSVRAHLSVLLSQREIQSLAFRTTLGLDTVSVSSLWELLPWSWLIDWFSDMGDILAAHRTGIPFTYSHLNIMCKTEYRINGSFPSVRPTMSVTLANPDGTAVHKTRTPVPIVWAFPTLRIPYLGARQWSILSSLLILRL